MGQGEVKPALLTRSEVAFLTGRLKPNPDFAKALRYRIIKKLKTFLELELPLLKETAKNWTKLEEVLKPLVTTNSHQVTTDSHQLENEPQPLAPLATHEVLAGPRGLEPLTPSSAGWCPIHARRRSPRL